jgi:hypothetical protein
MARSGQRQRKAIPRTVYRPHPIPDDAETTVKAIKAQIVLRRAEFRERIVQTLGGHGTATTSKLRSEHLEYRSSILMFCFGFVRANWKLRE